MRSWNKIFGSKSSSEPEDGASQHEQVFSQDTEVASRPFPSSQRYV